MWCFFPHSDFSSIIIYWVRSFFFQLPPFLKVPLFPLLLQLLPTPATFFFPSWKTSLAVSFFFFSPNNYLLFAPASHNECCVKVCTSFFPTTRILLSAMQWLSSSRSTLFPIMLSHHLLLLCPDCSSLSIYLCLSNFTEFVPFDISSPVLQSNHSPICQQAVPTVVAYLLWKYLTQ